MQSSSSEKKLFEAVIIFKYMSTKIAGNYAAKGSNTITYPALHPNVICVGACDHLGHMTPVSSEGREVDFLCPGKDVMSTGNSLFLFVLPRLSG